jgi:hypothetical protein
MRRNIETLRKTPHRVDQEQLLQDQYQEIQESIRRTPTSNRRTFGFFLPFRKNSAVTTI